jgi:hypothetical protein
LPAFCANVAAMPLEAGSIFIRPDELRVPVLPTSFAYMVTETRGCR